MTTPEGEFIATVRGAIPAEALQARSKEIIRRGRPRDEAGSMSLLAHFHMSRPEINPANQKIGEQKRAAATKLNLGDAHLPRNQTKQATTKIKKAEAILRQKDSVTITYQGDDGRLLWLAIENGEKCIQRHPDGWQVNGHGWECQWGDSKATYRHIKYVIPVGEQ